MDDAGKRVLVGMTGASGQIFGAMAVELLSDSPVEVHLILSRAAIINMQQEGATTVDRLFEMADETYDSDATDAPVADPSFETDAMVVAPCSMKTLAGVAHGDDTNLIARVASNQLTRDRPVVLMPREKPLNLIHLRNMERVVAKGGRILPPILETSGFDADGTVDAPVRRQLTRVLEAIGISTP